MVCDNFGDLNELECLPMEESVCSDQDGKDEEFKDVVTNMTDDKLEENSRLDYSLFDQRIKQWLSVLSDFKNAPQGLSRSACVQNLIDDLCLRYSYNKFLMRKLYDIFPKEVCFKFYMIEDY